MKGQDDINPLHKSKDEDSYNSKKTWKELFILLAGPFCKLS